MANEKLVTLSQLSRNNDKIKEELNKKIDVKQGVNNTNKILQVNAEGNLALVDMPDEVKISQEEGNAITEKDDGIYVPSVSETNISAEEGNAIVKKDDGLYVATPEEIKISEKENNQLTEEIDGLYVPSIDLTDYTKTEDVETLIDEAHYTTSVVSAHYEITDSTTENALEVVADGTATDGQIDISSVTPLLDGVTVSEGDYVVWIEAVTTKDAKFLVEADLDPYVAEEEVKVMTEEELLEKLGLSEEELQGLVQLISDTEVRIDKTYSSSKIYNELNRILEEGKTYTLAEIAKSSGASYKIASSTADMTSTKYIYLLANGDTYDMYICEEENSVPVKIGTTSVTLTDYYTKTECDERYVLATAFELLNNSVGDVNNLQTTSKVIVDAINEVVISVDGISTTVTETKDALGDITALETEAKDNVVNAVNEVKKSIDEFETYVELTQEEYDALADDETGKLNGTEYRTTDTGRIYKNGVQYGGQEPEVIESFAKYKEMKEAGLIDPDTEYLVTSDENGILLNGSDVGYSNAESGIQATTVQGAIDKVVEKVDNLIDDEVSDSTVWSSKKTSDEIAKQPLYCVYDRGLTGASTPSYFKLNNVLVTPAGQNCFIDLILLLVSRSGDKVYVNIGRSGGATPNEILININRDGNPSSKKIEKIYHNETDLYVSMGNYIDFFKIYLVAGTLNENFEVVHNYETLNTTNLVEIPIAENATKSDLVGTKTQYRGSRSIDISTGGRLTLIYSSEYASQAGCYMLLSNFNTEPLLIELGRNNIGQFKVTATHKSQSIDTITVTTAGDEYSWYVLQF